MILISTFGSVFLELLEIKLKMNQQQILDELLALLEDNGVELRSEPMGGGGGGLCTIKGKKIFFY